MLLAVDVGNTQTVLGLYRDGDLAEHWRVATDRSRTGDELLLERGGRYWPGHHRRPAVEGRRTIP